MIEPSRGRLACLDEDTLAAFAEGHIDAHALEPIEEHLADCGDCRAVLARAAGATPFQLESSAGPPSRRRAEALASGTRVGRYVVERLVGQGAMGEVYAATDPDLNRKVAVKVLRADALSDAARHQLRTRLLREAQAMARLSHPEVITVYDVGAFGDRLFVAMEYVEGETLRQWRAVRHRRYDEILDVYERAGSGLAAAHEAGLVHRDFKPDNVLFGRDGRVRVTDFGLARAVRGEPESVSTATTDVENCEERSLTMTLTRSGTLLGTPAYMAPEQLRGCAADARSDVFSFCVALYEALYGERPFPGSSMLTLQTSIDAGALRAAPVMTQVPCWVRKVLLDGLRPAPEQRFASMRALLDALRAAHAAARRRVGRSLGAGAAVLGLVVAIAVSSRASAVAARHALGGPSSLESSAVAMPQPASAPRMNPRIDSPDVDRSRPAALEAPPLFLSPEKPTPQSAARVATPSPPRPRPAPSSAASRVPLVGHNGALILE